MDDSTDNKKPDQRMRVGELSGDGFLGDDDRNVEKIISDDERKVSELGLSNREIAETLKQILRTAMDAQGKPVEVRPNLTAVYREARGQIPCPWPNCGVFDKGQVELSDESTGRTYIITPLSVHMIGIHGFYQGIGSKYRIEPADIAKLL